MIASADVLAAVAGQADRIRETMRFVHGHPELGHEERECSTHLCETLAAGGLEVERGVAGMSSSKAWQPKELTSNIDDDKIKSFRTGVQLLTRFEKSPKRPSEV